MLSFDVARALRRGEKTRMIRRPIFHMVINDSEFLIGMVMKGFARSNTIPNGDGRSRLAPPYSV